MELTNWKLTRKISSQHYKTIEVTMKIKDEEMTEFTKMMNWGIATKTIVKFSVYCNSDTIFISSIDSHGKGDAITIMGMGSSLTEAMISYTNERGKKWSSI